MKTTVDIPDFELSALLKNVGTSVKRDAIVTAIVDFNRRKQLKRLAKHIGSCKAFPSAQEIVNQRSKS